ncbi:hypothetical protein ACTNEO_19995 [Gracilibacillus sp. HCP3S3_G5_1]|uniref:hypothetical protein n=1 Tax=unclassified Gracilibacillus TaxID=2625209 RepID=UPI003F8CB3F9
MNKLDTLISIVEKNLESSWQNYRQWENIDEELKKINKTLASMVDDNDHCDYCRAATQEVMDDF